MASGKVKWFNAEKGYGFIAPDDGSADLFVHISELQKAGLKTLNDDQAVTFTPKENRGKMAASDIELA